MKYLFLLLVLSLNSFALSLDGEPAMKFTGYKFTDKTGVSGTFQKIDWNFAKDQKDLAAILKSASFKIDSHSIDAGNAARNTNITNALFKNWGSQFIEGKVKKVDLTTGYVEAEIKIGKSKHNVYFQLTEKDGAVELTGAIDLLAMGMSKAYALLNKQCEALHKGKDGIVKTWSTVDLVVNFKVK